MDFPLHVYPDRAALMKAVAVEIEMALRAGIAARGAGCAALSGGSTPGPAYERLARTRLPWPRVTFALVDERWLPPFHPDSNEGLLRRTLSPALREGARIASMWSEAPSLEAAAERAEITYKSLVFDVALMGMGADGHTASWFPGVEALRNALDPKSPRTVVPIKALNAAGSRDRLSLTLAAIARASRILLLITGSEKRKKLEDALASADAHEPTWALADACSGRLDVFWAE